jgi:EAL domain-containing protein (putative c-di-GMP-specific phosphodiesterase class I)
MKVIAEGVETKEQSRLLKLLKCDQLQGFLTGRPKPASDLMQVLKEAGEV